MVGKEIMVGVETVSYTDLSREQLELEKGFVPEMIMHKIEIYEKAKYAVKFETSLFRRLFCVYKYKIVAYELVDDTGNPISMPENIRIHG